MFQSTVVGIKQIEAKSKTTELPAEVLLLVRSVPDGQCGPQLHFNGSRQRLTLISIIVYHAAHYRGYFYNDRPFVLGKKECSGVNNYINDVNIPSTLPGALGKDFPASN